MELTQGLFFVGYVDNDHQNDVFWKTKDGSSLFLL